MNSKLRITILGLTLALIVSIISCQKLATNPESIDNEDPISQIDPINNENIKAKVDKNLSLLSKDAITGVIYRVKVKFNTDGSADIERSIVNGHENFDKTTHFISNDVPFRFDGDTIKIDGIPGSTIFHIPFEPGTEPCSNVNGGTTGKIYCQKRCNDLTTTCRTDNEGSNAGDPKGYSTGCSGSCTDCKAVSDGCGSGNSTGTTDFTKSGTIIIKATNINVNDL
ncbi:MAG: hypothetical protein IPM51_13475 [Sphingobacteriaceae bacterium]|nr:hypothetical protein [Sphingobacteriaceae bacterium]